MGEVVMMAKRYRKGPGEVLGALLVAAAMLAGCAGGQAPTTAAAEPAARPAPASASQPAIELTAIAVREGAPGMEVELAASGALVWTSYRDAEGRLIVELPNTRPAPALAPWKADQGLIAAVDLALDGAADRPLTRLAIATRGETEHTVTGEGSRLRLQFVGRGGEPVVAAEPLPREEPQPVAEPVASAPAEPLAVAQVARPQGTPEQPLISAPPSGKPASRLAGIELAGEQVRIAGDGEFAYSSFRLASPERLVIDLPGVINASRKNSFAVGSAWVDRVRVSQFKPQPEPISRVVFDLKAPAAAEIDRSAAGLTVRFASLGSERPTTLAEDLRATAPPQPPPSPAPAVAPSAGSAPEGTPSDVAEAEQVAETASVAPEPTVVAAETEQAPVEADQLAQQQAAIAALEPKPTTPTTASPSAAAVPARRESVERLEAADVAAAEPPAPAAAPPSGARTEIAPTSFQAQAVGGQRKVYVGEPISLSLKDGDIRDVLRSFAKISGLNMVVQPGVRGTVTVDLESVPWDQALDQILKINGLGYELDGNIMRIAPTATLRAEAEEAQRLAQAQALSIPLRTVLKRLSYSSAGEMAGVLRSGGGASILSQRGSIQIDGRSNTLIIKELPGYMDTVLAVIENLDIPEPQVMIEARIVETTKRFNRSLGIEWGFNGVADQAHGNTTGLVFPNSVEAAGGVGLLSGGRTGFLDLALGNVLDTFTLDATLQAFETEGLINVLSAPKVTVLNNVAAEIQSGLQIPVQTVANNTVTVQYVNATLSLQVTPQITAEGTVLMTIQVTKAEPILSLAVVGATNAPISTKQARTRVIVRDGSTTVIGGIYKVSSDDGQDRVPGLANVPILGHLFKNRRRENNNEELLIFITPRVVKL